MTGNLKLLTNFVEKFLGTVQFGNDLFALILGYRDLVQGNITIKRVGSNLNHDHFNNKNYRKKDDKKTKEKLERERNKRGKREVEDYYEKNMACSFMLYNTIRVNQLATIILIESLIHLLDQNRYPVITSLIHIESRKLPTAELFDVDSERISIVIVNSKEYHSDVLAISQG
ncbi:hypothetical protein Tco_0331224 [Tanacetum coccineum]